MLMLGAAMTRLIARRSGQGRIRSIPTPRIAHFYLNTTDHRLFCLDETARQFVREGVPLHAADLARQPLQRPDGSPVGTEPLPLDRTRADGQAHEDSFLLTREGSGQQLLTLSATALYGASGQVVGVTA